MTIVQMEISDFRQKTNHIWVDQIIPLVKGMKLFIQEVHIQILHT